MKNCELILILKEISALAELDGADISEINAWRRAARVLKSLSRPVAEMTRLEITALNGMTPETA
ncbi:MAG: hypothetical protein WCS77_07540, partial [Elusimicrobiaceae bacterium]